MCLAMGSLDEMDDDMVDLTTDWSRFCTKSDIC